MIGRLLCRLGRHRWEYLIFPDDDLVRWCPRCRRPNALTIIPAKRIPGSENATAVADRPVAADLDHDALSAAIGMLAAIARSDDRGFAILAKHSEPRDLVFSLCALAIDALQEPASDDLARYTDRLFDRLARRRQ
jgi:hypothetical protein